MALSVNINLAQKQKLIVTQNLREAIELLQLSSIELMDRIEQEIEQNPVLELKNGEPEEGERNSADEADAPAASEGQEREFDNEIMSEFDDSSDIGYEPPVSKKDPDSKQQFIEGALQRIQTFHEYLLNQLGVATFNDQDYQIGEIIISYIDDNGYLKEDVAELERDNPVSERSADDFVRLLSLIKSFDPPGVAAADLQECLLLQLQEREENAKTVANAIRVVKDHFDLLEKHRFKQIATKIGISQQAVENAAHLISQLEPHPGRQYSSSQVEYVVPDVIVKQEDDDFIIMINDEWIPGLAISGYYQRLLKNKDVTKKVKSYINEKFSSAQWLIKSIAQRRDTLYKVMQAILVEQEDFFRKGPGHLRPLTLKQIAERIEMHESTVSRVTSNKYVQTPWGLYSQKYFFSGSLRKENGQVESAQSVKELIKKIIEGESKDATVYSDQDIVGILNNKGIKIARRTVAKYRKMLKILPSSRRHAK